MKSAKKSQAPKSNGERSKSKASSTGSQLDILFTGPLLVVPEVKDGGIVGMEVFCPCNGHQMGALFVPGVWFTDAELSDPQCARWPEAEGFSLLDPHSYTVELTQGPGAGPFPVGDIPKSNHIVKAGRRFSGDWEVAIAVRGQLSAWSSHRISRVTDDLFCGADTPASGMMAAMHRLTYRGVADADFCGASKEPRDYLHANISKGGSLIIVGEIPYQPTLLHERQAIEALAKLAGLDLHLAETAPAPFKTRLMGHITNCAHSIVVA